MTILIVDDDNDDQALFQELLVKIQPNAHVDKAWFGDEAIEMLIKYAEKPDLILLDINMPRVDGRECLRMIREHQQLANLHVIVLSSSISPADKAFFARLNAPCLVKANDLSSVEQQLRDCLASCIAIKRLN